MRQTLEQMSKEQLIEVHRRVFGRVGDSGRTNKEQYIVALLAAGDAGKISTACAEVAAMLPPQEQKTKNRTSPEMLPEEAAKQLLAIVHTLAGAAVNEERVKEIADRAVSEAISGLSAREVKIIVTPSRTVRIEEHTHPVFEETLQAIAAGLNVLLVGPAGCGKSHLAAQIARALGREFGSLHCTAGASEAQLIGWRLPVDGGKWDYIPSQFVNLYSAGNSVFLLDELDAADPNMLLIINAALANGHLHVPSKVEQPTIERGKDSTVIAAANTYGNGADVIYAGRNQLDAATLDRFYILPMDYDRKLEEKLAPADVLHWAWGVREKVAELRLRRVISTRTIQKAAAMLTQGAEWPHVKSRLLAGWTKDELTKIGE